VSSDMSAGSYCRGPAVQAAALRAKAKAKTAAKARATTPL
jgi:hypothetical protein